MDAGGSGHLCQARQQPFHVAGGRHHQVGQFVDHDDDVGQRSVGVLRRRRVVGGEVTHAGLAERAVAAGHFVADPGEDIDDFVDVGDHGHAQVRDALERHQLDHLGVDQDELHFVGRPGKHDSGDQRRETDGLARTGGAGNKDMRHLGQVGHPHVAGDILAEGDLDVGVGRGPSLAFHDLPQRYDGRVVVGRLQPHERLTRHGCFDTHAAGSQLEGQVVG